MQDLIVTVIANMRAQTVAWLALAVSVVSAGLIIWRSRRDFRRQSSHDYLNAATQLLERAYDSFDKAREAEWNGLPKPDRILWLNVARTLAESEETARLIGESSHRALYERASHLYRGKFYDLLRPLRDVSLTYFAPTFDSITVSELDQRSPLSTRAFRVLIDFMEWPDGETDPVRFAKGFTEGEIERIQTFRYRALGHYLEAADASRNGTLDQRTHWRAQWPAAGDPVETESPAEASVVDTESPAESSAVDEDDPPAAIAEAVDHVIEHAEIEGEISVDEIPADGAESVRPA